MSMSYDLRPTSRRDSNPMAAVLTVSILVTVFVLLGISLMWFGMEHGFGLLPTPTVTATAVTTAPTATPDRRATNVAQDMLTQVAFSATSLAIVAAQTGATPNPSAPLEGGIQPAEWTATSAVQLPLISAPPQEASGPGDMATDPTASALTATAIFIPSVASPPTPTPFMPPTPLPAATLPLPSPIAPFPATETPTPPIIAPPPPTALPTSPVIQVGEMQATSRAIDTTVFIGPSTYYTATGTLAPNTVIRLRGRTASGDWLLGCCINENQSYWVRPAYVTIAGNLNPPGFPANVDTSQPQWNPNNPRWLPVFPPDSLLIPRPTPTLPPLGDYPLARYDRGNTGRVPAFPRPPLQSSWGGLSQAAQEFVSPLAVLGPNVVASSQDGQIYSINRDSGTQRWRFNLGTTTNVAPAGQDNLLYIPYSGNKMVILQDAGDRANVISTVDLPGAASTSPTFLNDVIFLGVGDGDTSQLIAMRRENPADRRVFDEPTSRLLQPAIGQETLYVPANRLWALDTNLWRETELLWTQSDLSNLTAAPVYVTPGVIRNSEIYAADQSGNIYALDANTGERIWVHPFGTPATSLAANDGYLYAAGGGMLRALSRLSGQAVWSQQTGGALTGGPWVTDDRILVALQGGAIFIYDALTGTVIDSSAVLPGPINVAPAVSQEWLFAPSGNTIFGYRGQLQ